jgi:hypothetical protein
MFSFFIFFFFISSSRLFLDFFSSFLFTNLLLIKEYDLLVISPLTEALGYRYIIINTTYKLRREKYNKIVISRLKNSFFNSIEKQ